MLTKASSRIRTLHFLDTLKNTKISWIKNPNVLVIFTVISLSLFSEIKFVFNKTRRE